MLSTEEQPVIPVFTLFLSCDDNDVNISSLHHHLTKYMQFNHILAISNVSRVYQYTHSNDEMHGNSVNLNI